MCITVLIPIPAPGRQPRQPRNSVLPLVLHTHPRPGPPIRLAAFSLLTRPPNAPVPPSLLIVSPRQSAAQFLDTRHKPDGTQQVAVGDLVAAVLHVFAHYFCLQYPLAGWTEHLVHLQHVRNYGGEVLRVACGDRRKDAADYLLVEAFHVVGHEGRPLGSHLVDHAAH